MENFSILLNICNMRNSCNLVNTILTLLLILSVIFLLILRLKKDKKNRSNTSTHEKGKEENEELKSEIARLRDEKEKSFKNGSLYSLILLQREGRLIDFLMEDISSYDDAQIGAAVRQIHLGCAKLIKEKFSIAPLIVGKNEGEAISLGNEFDPERVRVTGNAPSSGPYNGILRHKGWISSKIEFPKMVNKENFSVICQAEVESL